VETVVLCSQEHTCNGQELTARRYVRKTSTCHRSHVWSQYYQPLQFEVPAVELSQLRFSVYCDLIISVLNCDITCTQTYIFSSSSKWTQQKLVRTCS
jgi:hypothetical protein